MVKLRLKLTMLSCWRTCRTPLGLLRNDFFASGLLVYIPFGAAWIRRSLFPSSLMRLHLLNIPQPAQIYISSKCFGFFFLSGDAATPYSSRFWTCSVSTYVIAAVMKRKHR